ncbi:HAD-IA family hydrolase [Streptococcus sp. CSL10205-OR2]|uniref:HAD-IA family hydrolase n=1 Tax=Streptococcus sp. CSL10205-OR2 TaxID=2980558 RepID=UPI0021D875A9|nr:HAD-IA family hydrolase [Streptococcus sp. CSL10205-OR2]MCU9533834.1 HAD-IA family hydrolase [Streptococcus sp. CSL10205-OR2]
MTTLLFDLDGTLVNSSKGIINAFQYTIKALDLPTHSNEQLLKFIGPPLEETFRKFYTTSQDIDIAVKTFREYYNKKGVYEAELYSGILTLLNDLKKSTHQIYVTTSKNQPMANLMLENLKIKDYFNGVYGALPERYHKADVIGFAIKSHDLDKKQTIIVGDTKYDMIGGKKTGIKTIGVTWGFGEKTELITNGADIICHHPKDIKKHLKI